MNNPTKLMAALTISFAFAGSVSIVKADGPFRRYSTQPRTFSRNYSRQNLQTNNQTQTPSSATAYASSILGSPERMEKIYGPSILIRNESTTGVSAVTQP